MHDQAAQQGAPAGRGRRRTNRRRHRVPALLLAGALVAVGCSSADSARPAPDTDPPTRAEAPPPTPIDPADEAVLATAIDRGPTCEVLDDRNCLLPFPSDHFTTPATDTDTGRRIAFTPEQMPANSAGRPIDPSPWTGNDGFSPGTPLLAHLPTVDLDRSEAPTIGRIDRSLTADSPITIVDLDDHSRVPLWAELDANATTDADRLLIVRPARNLVEGHRHAVALRHLVDAVGTPIPAPTAFAAYRDNRTTTLPAIEERRGELEALFAELALAGVGRQDLVLAWSFTVASERNLSEQLLTMRDDALAGLGDGAPAFTVDEVLDDPAELDGGIARVVRGTFTVPSYLTGDAGPGSTLHDSDGDGLPDRNGDAQAPYSCQIPTASLTEPAPGVVYGHGLLGSHTEVESGHVARTAAEADLVYCATDWWGMSTADLPTVGGILGDLSRFPLLADRAQQGILNTVLLGRLLRSADGFATDPAFRTGAGTGNDTAVLEPDLAFYDGNSQGGVMGGAATAVSTEWTTAVLGVPGMNYSTLLRRSVDFVGKPGSIGFEDVLVPAYPDPVVQNLGFGLIQMLWDRAETDGYAAHLTDDPLPGTPRHTVVLHVAFGDHQVAPVTAEVLARTAHIGLRWPALDDGRHPDEMPFVGLDRVEGFPTERSVLVYWDSGTMAPPPADLAVVESEAWQAACSADPDTVPCADPHEDPRRQPAAIAQKDALFQRDGQIIDPCDGRPCRATPRSQL